MMKHQPSRLTPDLRFRATTHGSAVPTVGDFWRWAFSDLKDNVLRGVLAEFLVGTALGIDLDVRENWAAYDLETPDGITVEVKSTAYLQGWDQKSLSRLTFSRLRSRNWKPIDGYDSEATYSADVYVFCIQKATSHQEYDPLNIDQWEFRVLDRAALVKLNQESVGISTLDRLGAAPVSFSALAEAVQDYRGSNPV